MSAVPPGEVIQAGDARVHVVTAGPEGAPPLLISSGLGGAWFDWRLAVDLLRDRYRVVCFDRPGLGASPPLRTAPTLRGETQRMAALAVRMGPPVTVVAHSMAAFHAEALARTRPELVRGLVLLDPSCEGRAGGTVRWSRLLTPLIQPVAGLLAVTGLPRMLVPWVRGRILRHESRHTDIASAASVRAVYGRGAVLAAVAAEEIAYREMAADLAALRRRRPFPPIPLAVVTALGHLRDESRAARYAARHRMLAALSPHGRQIVLRDALHMVQLDHPEKVAEVVDSMRSGA